MARSSRPSCRPCLEWLEDRSVPSALRPNAGRPVAPLAAREAPQPALVLDTQPRRDSDLHVVVVTAGGTLRLPVREVSPLPALTTPNGLTPTEGPGTPVDGLDDPSASEEMELGRDPFEGYPGDAVEQEPLPLTVTVDSDLTPVGTPLTPAVTLQTLFPLDQPPAIQASEAEVEVFRPWLAGSLTAPATGPLTQPTPCPSPEGSRKTE